MLGFALGLGLAIGCLACSGAPSSGSPDLESPSPSASAAASPPPPPEPSASASEAPVTSPAPAPDVITVDDDGATFELGVDATVSLQLDSAWAWDDPRLDGPAVEFVPVDYALDPGFREWTVSGVEPGRVDVAITGDPNCTDAAECPAREVSFTFVVDD
jgi:hypothetical protein